MVKVLLDDLELASWQSLTVTKNLTYQADAFDLVIPNTDDRYADAFYDTRGDNFRVRSGDMTGTAAVPDRVPGQGPSALFTGVVDTVRFCYHPERTIQVRGRDYTARLIDEIVDSALVASLQAQSPAQVAALISAKFGLTPDVGALGALGCPASDLFLPGASIWDCLTTLARRCAADCWVDAAKTLHFRPRRQATEITRTYDLGSPGGPVLSNLVFDQDKGLCLALKAMVIGYDPEGKSGRHSSKTQHKPQNPLVPTGVMPANPLVPPSMQSDRRTPHLAPGEFAYTAESKLRNRANYQVEVIRDYSCRTESQAAARAQAELKRLSHGALTGAFTTPLDLGLEPEQKIRIRGPEVAEKAGRSFIVTQVDHTWSADAETTQVQFSSALLAQAQSEDA